MLGFIARCDNTGLGVESVDFVQHVRPEKLLVALPKLFSDVPERFKDFPQAVFLDRLPTPAETDSFLDGLDTLFCIELPYDWDLLQRARERGVRIVFRINYEHLIDPLPVVPDVMVAPIEWYQPPGAVILPFPVNRQRFQFRKRNWAQTFVHVAGYQGLLGRNGTKELLEAIPLVKSDVQFIIYSQKKLNKIEDSRIEWRIENFPDNSVLYTQGDVMVYPRRYGGQSLPMNEALSAGMPVMMTDMAPQNAFLPRELLIPYQKLEEVQLDRTVEAAILDPAKIAAKIDEWAHRDVSEFSEQADRYAESISWESLLPRYFELLGRTSLSMAGLPVPLDSRHRLAQGAQKL